MNTFLRNISILGLAVILVGCSANPTLAPVLTLVPTLSSAQMDAAATITAGLAIMPTATVVPATATMAASATSVPTATSAPMATATTAPMATTAAVTATLVPTLAATSGPTLAATSALIVTGCKITASSTSGADTKAVGSDFDARWTIQNTGSTTWVKGSTDYRYNSGTKMQKTVDAYDLKADLAAAGTLDVVVDMIAPKLPGVYQTNWIVAQGSTILCSLPVVVTVQ